MTQKEIILRQLQRAFEGPAWHGPSITEILDRVSPDNVNNSFENSHTIIQLIAHMTVWRQFVIDRLVGKNPYEVTEEMNFQSPTDLESTKRRLNITQQSLVKAIADFPDDRLREKVPTREYSFQTMLHGILHHDLYHIGQIALLAR